MNYYQVLGVEPSCSLEEIKRSFRKKAKELHPDLSQGNGKGRDTEQLNLLITAYRVLSDPRQRQEYDRHIRLYARVDTFDYRTYLKQRAEDRSSQSKLIFYDLLHDNEDEALELYEKLLQYSDYSLELYLDREDFMDCAFLLAEEYMLRRKYQKAFDLLMRIVDWEQKKPYFRHFFEEVVHRLRDLASSKLPLISDPTQMLGYYFQLIKCNFSPKEQAYYYKKISEVYLSLNQKDLAAEFLEKGLKLYSGLGGVKRIKEQIGIHEEGI
ncbi:MAG: J domain-containing protein [Spirochaetales bacterium]